jgi:GMP reductase
MRIENDIKLDFCDVLIRPKRSESPSRKNVDLTRGFKFLNSRQTWNGFPLIAANMTCTGTMDMARVFNLKQAMTALHKFYNLDDLKLFFRCDDVKNNVFYTLGINDDDFDKLVVFRKHIPDLRLIVVDAANGYTKFFAQRVLQVRELFPSAIILCGNVCTPEMVQELLLNSGADIIKIGIGPGSCCTTRIQTGVGYGQLSAIVECADAAHGLRGHVCADGGCTSPGDVAKAFGAGADFVMIAGLISGTLECEGEWTEEGEVIWEKGKPPLATGKFVKKNFKFYGMSSQEAMDKYSGGKADYKAAEGKCVEVPYKGPVIDILNEIMGGLRSACTYVGTESLKDLSKCTTFVKVNKTHNNFFGG